MCLFAVFASSPHIVSLCGCASGFFPALLSMGSHLVHGLSHPHIHTSSPEFAIDPNINLPPWCSTFSSSPGYSLFLVSFTWWFNPETWKSFIPCQFFLYYIPPSVWLVRKFPWFRGYLLHLLPTPSHATFHFYRVELHRVLPCLSASASSQFLQTIFPWEPYSCKSDHVWSTAGDI